MDVPDASDYWPDMAELLQQEGVAAEDILCVSAVSGQGVPELVRRVRARLEELPKEVRTGSDVPGHGVMLGSLGLLRASVRVSKDQADQVDWSLA